MSVQRATATIDLAALGANVGELRRRAGGAAVMAVVKADAYGHGLLPAAQAAVSAGAQWLGTALLEEGLALRAAGVTGPRILSWLLDPDDAWVDAVAADIDVSASAPWAVAAAARAGLAVGRPARVHLKVDSGLGRGGSPAAAWDDLVAHALAAQSDGTIEVVGLWSHLAYADAPHHPTTDAQLAAFRAAVDTAQAAGVRPEVRHLANSAATLTRPDTHFDLVRPGLAVYGLSPVPDLSTPAGLGLRPVMTLAAGRVRAVAGTVCMDQFVLDIGDDPAAEGDEVLLFGPGDSGEPSAEDWARACGTVSYEIVTRIGPRVPRVLIGAAPEAVR